MTYSYSFKDISSRLARDSERVCWHLLPAGKSKSNEWCVGSVHGEGGESLKIHLTGHKAGVWCDFATGDKGDLLELWRQVRRLSAHEAINEAKSWLGIKEDKPQFAKFSQKTFKKPEKRPHSLENQSKVKQYLLNDRKLTADTLEKYQIGGDQKNNRDIMVFSSIRAGDVIRKKSIYLDRPNGKKDMFVSKDSEPCLFGWHVVPQNARCVAIFEGEIDTMTAYQYGITFANSDTQTAEPIGMLSVPMGGGAGHKQDWINHEFERLAIYDRIYLVMDSDKTGQEAEKEILTRLGRERCWVVRLPFKDMNECLQKGTPKEKIQKCFDEAQTLDPEELVSIEKYVQEIKELFETKNKLNAVDISAKRQQKGYRFPWNIVNSDLCLRPDELSVWTGINGHGKSQLLGYIILHCLTQGAKVCIASLEMKPVNLGERLFRQISGLRCPAEETMKIKSVLENKFFLFDRVGTVNIDKLLEIFKYARQRYGVDVFVIDSLMKCGLEEGEYTVEKSFMDKLCDFKNAYNCHVHLVAHPRKQEDEYTPPGKMDVKGSGSITDLADNCFSLWRNVIKEEKLKEEGVSPKEKETQKEHPDSILACYKQRNGEWNGKIPLWFDRNSLQYLEKDQHSYSLIDLFHTEDDAWLYEAGGVL